MPVREGGVVWRSDLPLSPLAENLIEKVHLWVSESDWAVD